jgi:hypothetical protein
MSSNQHNPTIKISSYSVFFFQPQLCQLLFHHLCSSSPIIIEHKNLIFRLVKSIYLVTSENMQEYNPRSCTFLHQGMQVSPNLKHNSWLHSSRSLLFVARWTTTRPRASSDSFLLLMPWIAPSFVACALFLLDYLWSARSMAALYMYYGFRLL